MIEVGIIGSQYLSIVTVHLLVNLFVDSINNQPTMILCHLYPIIGRNLLVMVFLIQSMVLILGFHHHKENKPPQSPPITYNLFVYNTSNYGHSQGCISSISVSYLKASIISNARKQHNGHELTTSAKDRLY